jgi:hypothetical protein
MKYNTIDISQQIKDFLLKKKGDINKSKLCRQAEVRYQPISDLIYGKCFCFSPEYINKLLPYLHEYGFLYKDTTIDLAYIQEKTSHYFNVPIGKVKSESRKPELVQARQFIFKLSRKYSNITLREAGEKTGNKTHASVINAIKTLNGHIETESRTRAYYNHLEKQLK